jgi:NADPH:quinone reductase-like Zn-dependent oxidoreductase
MPGVIDMCKTRGYAITSQAIERERARTADDDSQLDISRMIELCEFTLPELGARDVKLRILAASAEHNVKHAALGDIVDIVRAQGGRMFLGNSAIAEVTAVGHDVDADQIKVGDIVQTHCNAAQDRFGYPLRIWAFDAPGSVGWYSEEAVVADWQVMRLPLACGLSLWQLAALPLRAPTAYHLWRRAVGIYRVKVPREQHARLNVLSFGGGVGELFLMLAKAEGHAAYYCCGNGARLEALARTGVRPINRDQYRGFAGTPHIHAFREHCRTLTGGDGMHIVCDMMRGSVFSAGLAVAAREGVNVSAGWQLGPHVGYNSALLSVKQITIDHTHYETIAGCKAATELYGSAFVPGIHHEIYPFEDLPRCFQEMHRNTQSGIPIIQVAKQLPQLVESIA